MIVIGSQLDARRQRLPELSHRGVHFVRYYHGVAVGLAVYREQHGRLAVRRHHRVLGFGAVRDGREIANVNRNPRRVGLHNDLAKLLGAANLAVDQPQHELMIVLNEAGRVHKVSLGDGVRNVRHRNRGAQELGRIRCD